MQIYGLFEITHVEKKSFEGVINCFNQRTMALSEDGVSSTSGNILTAFWINVFNTKPLQSYSSQNLKICIFLSLLVDSLDRLLIQLSP